MQHINNHKLKAYPSRYRAQLINSLSGFKSANLIATVDKEGSSNLAIFSSVVHLGASPALVGFIMRPNSVDRHTLENIQITEQYTINQVNQDIWQAAHQTSARYLRDECEFEKTGLTKECIEGVKVPFVKESNLKYLLTLQEIVPIKANNTLFVIGEITDILCQEHAIKDDGYIDIESLSTVTLSGLDSYHTTQRLSRLSYAKPESTPHSISIDGEK
ncbi:MAG: flavin reductase [Paraglaciecola sp.]|uniref:flavin reductase family protein n=1 Tax=Paraglaciecola sp. TaxID=1920173 RepID=UPI003297E338